MNVADNILTSTITKIIKEQVSCQNTHSKDVYEALHILLNGDYEKYNFNDNLITQTWDDDLFSDSLQSILSKINEKHAGQKETGRFYTPKDVTEYITANAFLTALDKKNDKVLSKVNCLSKILPSTKLNKLLFDYSVFDPTCGTAEFLVGALKLKIYLYEQTNKDKTNEDYFRILQTIHGNDINESSVEISKIRLFFLINSYLKDCDLTKISEILNSNFSKLDFLDKSSLPKQKYNIIIGNPPYIEDWKSETKPCTRYGNVYANVLENSCLLLDKVGVLGFVLPLSYIATARMKKIREIVNYHTPKQFLLNYADRPDCLFTGVHQKLTILISSKQTKKLDIHTSGYNYWYKNERGKLLSDIENRNNSYTELCYIPKIANEIESSIFDKILVRKNGKTFKTLAKINRQENIFLNMRGCFWIKAFSFNPGSKEYKGFAYDEKLQPYILCLLNSSLFFMFWIIVSDCWHITNKELSSFKVITNNIDSDLFTELAKKLEQKLEETKQYIGTKQAEYAYKHKFCKAEIDLIDNELAKIYNFSETELNYIKNYHLKYRISEK